MLSTFRQYARNDNRNCIYIFTELSLLVLFTTEIVATQ